MAGKNLDKMTSIDAELRLLIPGKLSEDDKLVEYDALPLDRFLDIVQDLHGEDLRSTVQECYELSAAYEGKRDPKTLEELGNVLTSLDPGDSVTAKAFSHLLKLANLAEEVQIAHQSTVDLVFTAHPTQSIRRSLLQKHGRIRNCLAQLYDKDITPDDKQELDGALQRELSMWRCNDELRVRADELHRYSRRHAKYFMRNLLQ
ncbi:phosphoenolpyruvate carboxylase 2 [Dorcoceras hygrometricum]|uniref:Phosphoenolpyruvate carboxylase 2 n=1 Tax=Dorcoceras hygrometricum TaxID=472368 RepID=A0A2Z7C5E9_9LAMI|nr:phosphoenolpyruvate carboxylase 2 [Dorcoceras hygrometricum]